jgi:hypothetical protein
LKFKKYEGIIMSMARKQIEIYLGSSEENIVNIDDKQITKFEEILSKVSNSTFNNLTKNIIMQEVDKIKKKLAVNNHRLSSAILQLKKLYNFDKKDRNFINDILKSVSLNKDNKSVSSRVITPKMSDYRVGFNDAFTSFKNAFKKLVGEKEEVSFNNRAYHINRNYEEIHFNFAISDFSEKSYQTLKSDYNNICDYLDELWIEETASYIVQNGYILFEDEHEEILNKFKFLFNSKNEYYQKNLSEIAYYQLSLIKTNAILDSVYHKELLEELQKTKDEEILELKKLLEFYLVNQKKLKEEQNLEGKDITIDF